MKAIILISSIFYILGLKISNKIDLVKKNTQVDKVITNKVTTAPASNNIEYNKAKQIATQQDSIKGGGGICDESIQESK